MRRALLLTVVVAALFVLAVVGLVLVNRPRHETSSQSATRDQPVAEDDGPESSFSGLNLTAYTRNGYGRPAVQGEIERIAALGANAITLTPTWYMDSGDSNVIRPDSGKTPSMQSLRLVIGRIRDAGLKVILKPHVDVLDDTFRGDIQPADRPSWFRSYGKFIGRFAALAAEQDAELFVVGTELKSLSGETKPWRTLIRTVRAAFPGPLTYAANWDELRQVRFGDGLDLIGVDAYFPLAEGSPDPTVAELAAAWEPILDSLRSVSELWGKPLLLTEVGYPSQIGAAAHPWEVRAGEPADPALQDRAYRAVFKTFRDQPWLAGINWWSWRADPGAEETPEIDYSPEGKPAENTLRREWGSPATG